MSGLTERLLRRFLPYKELGLQEHGETFTRFTVLKTSWFRLYVHRLDAPLRLPRCHDHPWHFWTFILTGGYWEEIHGTVVWRSAGSVLYRPAPSPHGTVTRKNRPTWSVVIASPKKRDWGFVDCTASHWLTEKT